MATLQPEVFRWFSMNKFRAGKVKRGDQIVFSGFGAGLAWVQDYGDGKLFIKLLTMPQPLLMTLLIGLGVIVYIQCLLWFIGKLSGWQKLAQHYPLTKQPFGKSWHWQNAKISWAQYNGALTFCR